MTRFLMSLEESVDLVLYAFTNCKQGDILVQKAAASAIGDLAEALKLVFGKNNPTAIIGTRHGEKLYETLIMSSLDADDLMTAIGVVRDDIGDARHFAGRVPDYEAPEVSAKVARIVFSDIDYVNRVAWSKP
jgi:FlaA1/EpsC-like NDP-sugar epimerase